MYQERKSFSFLNGVQEELLSLIIRFLSDRQQQIILNGKTSDWKYVSTGVPQGSVLEPLFCLVYIDDLAEGLVSDVVADDAPLFSIVYDEQVSADILNADLKFIPGESKKVYTFNEP